MKLKGFCTIKEMVSKLKRLPTEWKKIFASYTSEKGLITRIYKEFKNLNSSQINDPIKKWATQNFFKGRNPNGQKTYEKGALIHCWQECKLVQPLWKTMWRLLKKLNIDLPYDSAISLLGIHPKECLSDYYKGNCTPMFIAALFTISKL
jgi:hypothetical protein